MENILDVLFLNHKTWLDYVKSFGCNEDDAEDFVQEMYIKIFNYSKRKDSNSIMFNDTEVNNAFIYTCLKNMHTDYIRKNKKLQRVELKDYVYEDEYTEEVYNLKLDAVENFEFYILNEIKNIKENNKRKTNLTYIHFVFEKIFKEQMSVSEFSREVGITYWSLRNTVLLIKEIIKNGNDL